MNSTERVVMISVPESLIPNIQQHVGPVLFYMDKLHVIDGFPLAADEFVISLRLLEEAKRGAGLV